MNETPSNPNQFSLKEIFAATTGLCVLFAISRILGGFGAPDIAIFTVGAASALLATSRILYWLGTGVLFAVVTTVLTLVSSSDPPTAMFVGAAVFGFFVFAGAPLAIALARKLQMRRWVSSEIGILAVATALTPPDPFSTALVYGPLQLAMLGYVFFAIDGKPAAAE